MDNPASITSLTEKFRNIPRNHHFVSAKKKLEIDKFRYELKDFIALNFGEGSKYMVKYKETLLYPKDNRLPVNEFTLIQIDEHKWLLALSDIETMLMEMRSKAVAEKSRMPEGWKLFWAGTVLAIVLTWIQLRC